MCSDSLPPLGQRLTSERMQQPLPFAHVHAPKAALYRHIMRTFVDAKRRFLVHLRPEDIVDAIQGGSADSALTALVEWGNLRAYPDTSRVTSVEEFDRARHL
jgi:uncharacterized protein DUF2397